MQFNLMKSDILSGSNMAEETTLPIDGQWTFGHNSEKYNLCISFCVSLARPVVHNSCLHHLMQSIDMGDSDMTENFDFICHSCKQIWHITSIGNMPKHGRIKHWLTSQKWTITNTTGNFGKKFLGTNMALEDPCWFMSKPGT